MNEQERPAGPGGPAAPGPAIAPQPRRASVARAVITSRGAGWAVAAVLAGAVTALSILLAAGPSPEPVAVRVPIGGPIGAGPFGPATIQVRPGGQGFQITAGGPATRHVTWTVPAWMMPGPGVRPAPIMSLFGQVAAGTVGSMSGSAFTIAGPGGQTITVREQPSTSYRKAGSPASASAVTRGSRVAVLGSLSGASMTATVVAVLP